MNATSYTILVVDDESLITNTLSRVLRASGYRVVATQNPLEAIAILSKQHIDILLSDVEMPGISGIELVKLASKEFPGVLRILLTGHVTTENMLRAINEGQVFRYLPKPFDNKQILETMKAATEQLITMRQLKELSLLHQQQEHLKAELEEEYPGLHAVKRKDGVYVLDTKLLLEHAQTFEHPFIEFLKSS
jgi:adenylate cyclase